MYIKKKNNACVIYQCNVSKDILVKRVSIARETQGSRLLINLQISTNKQMTHAYTRVQRARTYNTHTRVSMNFPHLSRDDDDDEHNITNPSEGLALFLGILPAKIQINPGDEVTSSATRRRRGTSSDDRKAEKERARKRRT